jgi:hypothetical protein
LKTVVFDSIEDPDGRLPPLTRRAIAHVTLSELDRRLEEDPQLATTLDGLWERAREAGFTVEHREAIVGAHVSRARLLVTGILNRVVAEAFAPRHATAGVRATHRSVGHDPAFLNPTKH